MNCEGGAAQRYRLSHPLELSFTGDGNFASRRLETVRAISRQGK